VLIIYVVDAEGKRESSFAPVIDGTLKGPEAVFALLRTYLQQLGITQADQVLFIADGAPWIWKRVPVLVQTLGLAADQVHEVLDFYHAAEHLGKVSALRKDWSAKVRSRWRNRGAVESTVRRVVNLRLKGASIFWCRASAEAILLLRSYYKAGRWNLLKRMATSHLALLKA
jgi:hypothetical protein